MESLENGLQPYSGVTLLFSIRILMSASSQSIAADAWCKWVLILYSCYVSRNKMPILYSFNFPYYSVYKKGRYPWLDGIKVSYWPEKSLKKVNFKLEIFNIVSLLHEKNYFISLG